MVATSGAPFCTAFFAGRDRELFPVHMGALSVVAHVVRVLLWRL